MESLELVFIVIFVAFIFDFINGFHDAANSIATIVSTGVLKPFWAVLWAAFFNFIAFLFFHLNVANTFGVGLVSAASVTPFIIFAALAGAIIFNLFTWYFGLPSSSSHALIGGLVGAAVMHDGWSVLVMSGITKVLIAIIISPILGILFSGIILWLMNKLFMRKNSTLRFDKSFQLISAAMLSLGHGANDAQKTMGIIAIVLFSSDLIGPHFYIPFWVVLSCNALMGLGTMAGGWRIVRTMGEKITPLQPRTGAAAETGSALVLFIATSLGIPVSTTHIVTGAICGVGMEKGMMNTNWQIMKKISLAWIVTLPTAGLIAASVVFLAQHTLQNA